MSYRGAKDTEPNTHVLEVLISKEDFENEKTNQFKKQSKRISIPGFRKGKAPRGIIEKYYGKNIFDEDAIDSLLPAEYDAALKESSLTPITRPEVKVDDIDDEGVHVSITIITKPEADIEGYNGLELERLTHKVTDEEIDADISRTQKRYERMIDVEDRPAELEDTVNIDYTGSVDGVEFDGGSAKGQDLKLGSGTFIPGFEDQIVGHNIGDEFDVNVTFPEDYNAEELKGKAAVFKTKLNSIKRGELPALDDEFAKDLDFDTFADYRAHVKEHLEEHAKEDAERGLDSKIYDFLEEHVKADIPHVMIHNEIDAMVGEYDSNLRAQGLSLDLFMQYTGDTMDSLREKYHPSAERRVKARLGLEAIARLEKIEVTDEEIDKEIADMAKAYGVEEAKITEVVTRDNIADDIKCRKASEFIKEHAKITDKELLPEKPEEKAEKPKTAKKTTGAKKTVSKKAAEKKDDGEKKATAAKKPAAKKTATKKDDGEKAEKPAAKKSTATKKAATTKKTATKKTEKKED